MMSTSHPFTSSPPEQNERLLFYRDTAAYWHTAYQKRMEIYSNDTGRILAEIKVQMDRIEEMVASVLVREVCSTILE